MAQCIREVIRYAGKVAVGATMLGSLFTAGTGIPTLARNTHASHATIRPSFVASSLADKVIALYHPQRTETLPAALRLTGNADAALGGEPPAGGSMKQQGTTEAEENTIEFHGTITRRVGADHMLHFTVGSIPWSIPLTASTDLHKMGGSAECLQPNQKVEIEVQVTGNQMVVTEVEPEE